MNQHSDKVLPLRAEKCGTMPRHPRIYGEADFPLDDLFSVAETRIDDLMAGLAHLRVSEIAPAAWFVLVAAPYVGQLLARHPRLEAPRPSDLTRRGSVVEPLVERYGLTWAMMDRVTHNAVWSLAISPEGRWTTNDSGCLFLPGRGSGSLLVPLDPRVAVFLTSGKPTYRPAAREVRIKAYDWSRDDQDLINDLTALAAPREVYAFDSAPPQRALDLWAGRAQPKVDARGLSASLMTDFAQGYGPLAMLAGSWVDSELSRARFFASTHRFACDCQQQAQQLPPEMQGLWLTEIHEACDRGAASLRQREPVPDYEDAVGINVSEDGRTVLMADRQGLRTARPSPVTMRGWIDSSAAVRRS